MAMTELGLLFIGFLATLATLGLFADFRDEQGRPDRATQVLVAFLAAVLWGTFGLSASDVYVDDAASVAEPLEPLFWLGVIMALLVGLYAIYELLTAVFAESTDTDLEAIGGR